MALAAGAVLVPVPFTGIAHPLFLLPYVLTATYLALAERVVPPLPRWLENLLAPCVVVAVVAAGGWPFGVLRPVTNLLLLLAAIRLPGCAVRRHAWKATGLLALVGLAGIASSTHPLLVLYLVGLEVLLLGMVGRLVVATAAEEGRVVAASRPLRAGRVTAVTVGVGVLLAAPLFVLLPRLRSPFAAASFGGRAVSGFRDAVALHRIGDIKASREVVLRLTFPGEEEPPPEWLRLVGSTVQHYRAGVWVQGRRVVRTLPVGEGWTPLVPAPPPGPVLEGQVRVEQAGEVLFVPVGVVAVTSPAVAVSEGPLGILRVPAGTTPPVTYGVRFQPGWVSQQPPGEADLEVPARLAWLRSVAEEAAAGSRTTLAAALAVERYLRDNYAYSTRSDAPLRRDPVEWFLKTSRAGHCEFFASSMVLLLRSLGIPARLQAGFAGGERDGRGSIVVRQSHAHAWVVAWVGVGEPGSWASERGGGEWQIFDPTPAEGQPVLGRGAAAVGLFGVWEEVETAWDRWVLTFSLADQLDAVHAAIEVGAAHRDELAAAVLVMVAMALVLRRRAAWARRRRSARRPPTLAGRLLARVYWAAHEAGLGTVEGTTPRALLALAAPVVPAVAQELALLVTCHERERYGGAACAADVDLRGAARRVVRALAGFGKERDRAGGRLLRAPRR